MVRKKIDKSVIAGIIALSLFLLGAISAFGQQWETPTPGYVWSFPRDHANHPGQAVEWWYYTGHLLPTGADASDDEAWIHLQLTFFRSSLPGPNTHPLYFAHLAMSGGPLGEFAYAERIARGTLGEAGADNAVYNLWLDDWRASLISGEHFLEAYDDETGGVRLLATPEMEPVLNGEDGFSAKSEDDSSASYYYSIPRMAAKGWVLPQNKDEIPIEVSGELWMDHEFGNQRMEAGITGWDWWGLPLPDGGSLMFYLIRNQAGNPISKSEGVYVDASGQHHRVKRDEVQIETLDTWTSPHSGAAYPQGWRITIPSFNLDLTVTPVCDDQELRTNRSTRVTYYEGAVKVRLAGVEKRSFGYVELVGYAD